MDILTYEARGENRPLTSLRGLAAVWVVFSHITLLFADRWGGLSWRMLRAGYMGVDVFFVLSGFILGIVYQGLTPAAIPRFFWRRILRLYPLNIAVLLILAFLAATIVPFGSWTDPHELPIFVLMVEGYMARPVAAWNPVTWSVGMELACYACFPVVIIALRRLPIRPLALLAMVLLAGCWWVQGYCLGWANGWHALARAMSGFWPGVVLGTVALRLPAPSRRWCTAGEVACLAGIICVVATNHLRVVPLLAGGLIFLLYSDSGQIARALRAGPFFWLGRISFSIYMLFGVALPLLFRVFYWLSFRMPIPAAMILFIAFYLVTVFALAHLTYITIEVPFRRLGRVSARIHPAA